MAKVYLGETAIAPVVESQVPETKYGVSINNLLGTVDANGAYQIPTAPFTVDLSAIKSIPESGLAYKWRDSRVVGLIKIGVEDLSASYALSYAFYGCTGLTSVDLSSLTTINGGLAMSRAFEGCRGLTTMSFPALKEILSAATQNQFNNMFVNCTNLTEIHFPSNMQERVEQLTGYSTQFGATNATIYFDLPSTADA